MPTSKTVEDKPRSSPPPYNPAAPQVPIKTGFKALDVSPPTGYKLIDDGLLETHVIGGRRYTTPANLEKCVKRLQERPAPLRKRKGA